MSDSQTNLTLRQRQRLQQSDGAAELEPTSKRRFFWPLLSVGLVVFLAAGVWAWIHFHPGTDPKFQEIMALQAKADQMVNPMSEEAQALQRKIWDNAKDLPENLKSQVRDLQRHSMETRFDRFFGMSTKDQLAQLDMAIAGFQAMEAMQKVKAALGGTDKAGADSNKPGGPGGPGGFGRTDAQKIQGWQKRLSSIPPERRAQWTLGWQMFNARIQQQGGTAPTGGFF